MSVNLCTDRSLRRRAHNPRVQKGPKAIGHTHSTFRRLCKCNEELSLNQKKIWRDWRWPSFLRWTIVVMKLLLELRTVSVRNELKPHQWSCVSCINEIASTLCTDILVECYSAIWHLHPPTMDGGHQLSSHDKGLIARVIGTSTTTMLIPVSARSVLLCLVRSMSSNLFCLSRFILIYRTESFIVNSVHILISARVINIPGNENKIYLKNFKIAHKICLIDFFISGSILLMLIGQANWRTCNDW